MSTSMIDEKPAVPASEATTVELWRWTTIEFWDVATHADVLQYLSAGADPNAIADHLDETVLNLAIGRQAKESVQALLDAGADVNGLPGIRAPLFVAACVPGLSETVRVLIAAKADVNATNARGETPAHIAADAGPGSEETLGILIDAGANIHACTRYGQVRPLHLAARQCSAIPVALLLKHGANPHALDSDGRTPLHWVGVGSLYEEQDMLTAINALLDAGCDIEALDNNGASPLRVAGFNLAANRALALLATGANIEAQAADGSTVLHTVVGQGDMGRSGVRMLRILLDHDADPNARNKNGHTPLGLAENHPFRNEESVDILHESSARKTAQDRQATNPPRQDRC